MQSKATTVAEYLRSLPEDRRHAIEAVRKVILANLDKDYVEGMGYGMIGYSVPHRVFPAGYHCDPKQPLPFACLASQKNHMALYLMAIYGSAEQRRLLEEAWARTGKKLDMGKSCIRFKKVEDLPLDVIGAAIRRVPAKKYVEHYLIALNSRPAQSPGGKSTRGASSAKKAPAKAPARRSKAKKTSKD